MESESEGGRSGPSSAGYRVHQHEVERCKSLSVCIIFRAQHRSGPSQWSARCGKDQQGVRSERRAHGRLSLLDLGREIRETVRAELPGGADGRKRRRARSNGYSLGQSRGISDCYQNPAIPWRWDQICQEPL
jgi:hypothetical protein